VPDKLQRAGKSKVQEGRWKTSNGLDRRGEGWGEEKGGEGWGGAGHKEREMRTGVGGSGRWEGGGEGARKSGGGGRRVRFWAMGREKG